MVEADGFVTRAHKDPKDFGVLGLHTTLKQFYGDKHIPGVYLRASREQRLALLQGLIDSDGHVAKDGQIEFCSTNQRLAVQVRELVTTFGVKSALLEGRATLNGKDCGAKYRVMFYMAGAASLPRKAERTKDGVKHSGHYLKFEAAGRADTVCIEVAHPSHTFLAGEGMFPTCNSEIVSRKLPGFMLGLDPTLDLISVSAEAELAQGFGRDVRNLLDSPEYRNVFPDVGLSADSTAKGRWNTRQGGSYYAVGIGGSLFGRGGGAIIDDPFKSWDDAQSERQRERVWDWFRGTLYNRIRPGQPIILIQHRMHEDDLAGRLLKAQEEGGDRWEVVEIPADLNNPPWPERYDAKALERIRANTGSRQWNSLYLQNPTPEEGTFFKRENFWRFDPEEAEGRVYQTGDFAVTEPDDDNDPDYTSIGAHKVAQDADGMMRLWLCFDGWRGQRQFDGEGGGWINNYFALVLRHKPMVEFAEVGVIRRAIEGVLTRKRREKRAFGRVEWMPHIGDKIANARALQDLSELGQVGIARGAFGDAVLEALVAFPNGKHDDDVDMCALMARAVNEAHPLVNLPQQPVTSRDRWDDAFDDDDGESWRV
jgi:hypothetical protein